MKRYRSIGIALILPLLIPTSLSARDKTDGKHFMLNVRLQDVFNRDFEIRKRIELGKLFCAKKTNGRVRNTISGVLLAGTDGKFKLGLTVSEWASEKSNITDRWELELELNKAWSGGPIASFAYMRTVNLSRDKR